MRAVVYERYGPPDVLHLAEINRPAPKQDEVLVRVVASTVTRTDTGLRRAEYPFTRLGTGLRRPRQPVPGTEFAGEVVEAGATVTTLRPGDEVFGIAQGANAEYVVVRERGLIARKPAGLSFEEAAALPDGALLALSCLQPALPLQGKRVMVYGAAGSIGTAAVQLLVHHFRADVTAVCDTKDVDLVRSLGAREVLDRFQMDVTRSGRTYDVFFDAVGKLSFRRCRRALTPRGIYITLDLGFLYHAPLVALFTALTGGRQARVGIGRYRRKDLLLVKRLVEAGAYRPVLDRGYTLDEIVEAARYVESGRKTGNVVLHVGDAGSATLPESAASDAERSRTRA